MTIRIGLQNLLDDHDSRWESRRIALLANSASVDSNFQYSWNLIRARAGSNLKTILSPQHGLFGEQQANMIESPHELGSSLRIPIYSLYSETREPTDAMLDGVDLILIDLQDVGTRIYTFIWSVVATLKYAAGRGIEVWLLDRPNPLGRVAEGPRLDPQYKSFVGGAQIPMRHGLTMGELAQYCCFELGIRVNLRVICCTDDTTKKVAGQAAMERAFVTNVPWVLTSPNMPNLESAWVYPGQVLWEGTTISEGRGSTTPFQICGAPWIDSVKLQETLTNLFELPGVAFRPIRFVPTFDKYRGERCEGLFLHVTDRTTFSSYRSTIAIMIALRKLWPEKNLWLDPPYEYERVKAPIDILSGSAKLRESLEQNCESTAQCLEQLTYLDQQLWWRDSHPFHIYP